jgi:addiction module HigA family antidote
MSNIFNRSSLLASPKGSKIVHPGQFIRETVLVPKGISVAAAAKIIGVSRPGVSSFINGKVAATQDMAARIERAFNVPAQTLLDMQTAYDAAEARKKGAPANTKTYVPPFLGIKAKEVEAWASSPGTMTPRGQGGTGSWRRMRGRRGFLAVFRAGNSASTRTSKAKRTATSQRA